MFYQAQYFIAFIRIVEKLLVIINYQLPELSNFSYLTKLGFDFQLFYINKKSLS